MKSWPILESLRGLLTSRSRLSSEGRLAYTPLSPASGVAAVWRRHTTLPSSLAAVLSRAEGVQLLPLLLEATEGPGALSLDGAHLLREL